jgi:hypothetical protein
MFSCHRTFRLRQLSLSHALGTQTLSAVWAAAFLDLQLLSTPAELCYSALARLFRIVTETRASVLRLVRVWLRRDAGARTSAGQRTRSRLRLTDVAVAEAVGGANPCVASRGFVLASALLRRQRVEREQICGKAEIHPSQPSHARIGETARGLAVEQLSSLSHRRGRNCQDRITMDGAASGEAGNCAFAKAPPKRSLNGAP